MQQIETLYLPDSVKNSYQNVENQPLTQLDSLSRVNILVGANNSGKSRFMRLLAVENGFNTRLSEIENINTDISRLIMEIVDSHRKNGRHNINGEKLEIYEDITKNLSDQVNTKIKSYTDIEKRSLNLIDYIKRQQISDKNQDNLNQSISSNSMELINIINQIQLNLTKNIYIPTLRGLRPLNSTYDDFYKQQTLENYFKNQYIKPEVFTGLGLYTELRSYLLGDNAKRKKIKEYQDFISRSLFGGKEVTLIPSEEQKIVVVKIGNELERPIHELGDGIQSAIILTFLPFVSLENCIFFIEEPELFLHPSMQRKILEFYHSLERHLFFMTTHSNHLLDITIDIPEISIYSFRKLITSSDDDQTPQFVVENVDDNQSSSLELLGVRNSSVLLVNATIWVEGITDRWYLREMLRMYMKTLPNPKPKLEEDIHYAFVEYGGDNIKHFSFLDMEEHPIIVDRLCAKAIVIIDQDDEQKKLERKQQLQDKLGDRLIILPCREIENSLPPEAIRSVVIEYETTKQNPKPEVNSFIYADYQNEPLGTFIKDIIIKGAQSRRGCYDSGSGTITDKLGFCKRALKYINPLTDAELAKLDTEERQLRHLELFKALPESTQQIITKIYDFIAKLNPS